jgi:hypothetical protein
MLKALLAKVGVSTVVRESHVSARKSLFWAPLFRLLRHNISHKKPMSDTWHIVGAWQREGRNR